MINNKYLHSKLTSQIIGCAIEVHNTLGNGFQEVVYQRSLAIEFSKNNIPFSREHEVPLVYKGHNVGSRRVDFLVSNQVMVELKAITYLEKVHLAQAINYLEAYNLQVGLMINFGSSRKQFKRVINTNL